MSRNLGETSCHFCDHELVMVGDPRPIARSDAGVYFDEYQGMIVRNAECPCCLAQYLAWVKPPLNGRQTRGSDCPTHYDLSFRSTFDDEPGERDLPRYKVETRIVRERVGPFDDATYLRIGEYKEPKP